MLILSYDVVKYTLCDRYDIEKNWLPCGFGTLPANKNRQENKSLAGFGLASTIRFEAGNGLPDLRFRIV